MIDTIKNQKSHYLFIQNNQNFGNKNVSFTAKKNSLERTPESDEYKKGMSKGAKVGLGTAALIGIIALGDQLIAKGKYRKQLFNLFKKETAKIEEANKPIEEAQTKAEEVAETVVEKAEEIVDNATQKIETAAQKIKKELTPKQQRQQKLKELYNGEIESFTFEHSGNTFVVENGKLVSYKNGAGEDLLSTFETLPPALEYKQKIDSILHAVKQNDVWKKSGEKITNPVFDAENNLMEFMIEDAGNKFVAKRTSPEGFFKLESYVNEKGEDLLSTFDIKNHPDMLYKLQITEKIANIKNKDKNELANVVTLKLKGSEEAYSPEELRRYIKNSSFPTSKFGKNGKYIENKDGSQVTIRYGNDNRIAAKTIVYTNENIKDTIYNTKGKKLFAIKKDAGNKKYKQISYIADDKVVIHERCDAKGNPLDFVEKDGEKFLPKLDAENQNFWRVITRNPKNKGEIVSNEVKKLDANFNPIA